MLEVEEVVADVCPQPAIELVAELEVDLGNDRDAGPLAGALVERVAQQSAPDAARGVGADDIRAAKDIDDLLHAAKGHLAASVEEHAAILVLRLHADLCGIVAVPGGQRVEGAEVDNRREPGRGAVR